MSTNTEEAKERSRQSAEGTKAVRAYLEALAATRLSPAGRGGRRPIEEMNADLKQLRVHIADATEPMEKLALMAKAEKLGIRLREQRAADLAHEQLDDLAGGFIKHAAAFAARKGNTYEHFLAVHVPPDVLAKAGLTKS